MQNIFCAKWGESILEDLLISSKKRLNILKEESSKSSSRVIIHILLFSLIQTLFFNNSIIMFLTNGFVGESTLDENSKVDFVENEQMVKKNLSGFSGVIKEKKKGSFQG